MHASATLAAVVLLWASSAVAQERIERPSRTVVEGYGESANPPEVATIAYTIRGEGKSSNEAVVAMVAIASRVENGLRAIDPVIEPKVRRVDIELVRGSACEAGDEYNSKPRLSTGECAIVGYVAQQRVSAQTKSVTDAGTLVSVAGRAGAVGPEISDFGLANETDARRLAIAAALQDARAKAEAIADAGGFKLGPIVSVALDGARDSDEITLTGTLRPPPPEPVRDEIIRVKLDPRPIETSARVTVAYEIRR